MQSKVVGSSSGKPTVDSASLGDLTARSTGILTRIRHAALVCSDFLFFVKRAAFGGAWPHTLRSAFLGRSPRGMRPGGRSAPSGHACRATATLRKTAQKKRPVFQRARAATSGDHVQDRLRAANGHQRTANDANQRNTSRLVSAAVTPPSPGRLSLPEDHPGRLAHPP